MIALDPNTIKEPTVIEFYKTLAQGLGCSSGRMSLTPYAAQGKFQIQQAAAATIDAYFDLANPAFGNIPLASLPTYPGRTLLIGNLFSQTYTNNMTGGAAVTWQQNIATGPASGVTQWLMRRKQNIIVDESLGFINAFDSVAAPTIVKTGFTDVFQDLPVSFLRMIAIQTGVGTSGVVWEWLFNGVRIDF